VTGWLGGYYIMDNELFMYQIMTALYNMKAPIVFKGAMVLKVIQAQTGNPSGLTRWTKDIDCDWVGQVPAMQYLHDLLQNAVYSAGYNNILVETKREYGKGKSAGFIFKDRNTNETVSKIDISICKNNCLQQYSYINGIYFVGQSVNKIITDKIVTCSKHTIQRRIKDMIDLYILSYSWNGNNTDILELARYLGYDIGDFSIYCDKVENLRHAYSKYSNPASILEFDIVYKRVYQFLEPFIKNISDRYYWNGNVWNSNPIVRSVN
jgi:hypothetical protein